GSTRPAFPLGPPWEGQGLLGSEGGSKGGMMKRLLFAAVSVSLMTVPGSALAPTGTPLSPSSLPFPAAFTATPDGTRILYGERYTGRIRWLDPATGMSTPFFTVPNVASDGDQGLWGLALPPNSPSDSRVWAFATRTVSGTAKNQLLRIRADGGGFTVLRRLPTTEPRNGGCIIFGP